MSIILMIGLTVGDRVRECRRSRKWSQAELAKRASVSQVTISHVENKQQYQDIEISSENMNLIQVEGRVVWRGGSL